MYSTLFFQVFLKFPKEIIVRAVLADIIQEALIDSVDAEVHKHCS